MGRFGNGDQFVFKLLLAGDSTVGKSSLMEKYSTNYFPYEPASTIGVDFTQKEIKHDGMNIKIQMWDTAGQERFRSIITSYYRGADGIILCYDTTNRQSFSDLVDWLEIIK